MISYSEFQKTNIDLSVLGFEPEQEDTGYYCTPKNADIIGRAGVDGIHYCTIPMFGDLIFTVSPMNFGDCVHPIARNFEDLLRLLLNGVDMAALEQCYAWDRAQYEAFLIDCPVTSEQEAVLNELREKLKLEPMSDAYSYVKALQAEFDYSELQYKEEYYETVAEDTPEQPEEWSVYYDGGFLCRSGKGRAGKEITVNKRFSWNNESWYIPSVYACSKGLVIDFCVEIEVDRFRSFLDKWQEVCSSDAPIDDEQQTQLDRENPLSIEFRPHVYVNDRCITEKSGMSCSWLPKSCLDSGEKNSRGAESVVRHYRLDERKVWSIHRCSCSWTTTKRPAIKSIKLRLEREKMQLEGTRFEASKVGDTIKFTHPIFKTEHELTVCSYERSTISYGQLSATGYPTCGTKLEYTLSPDIPSSQFSVVDCKDSDSPNAASIAVIGGADGPTSVFVGVPRGSTNNHSACSALTFEPQDKVKWKMIFREKPIDDIEVELI